MERNGNPMACAKCGQPHQATLKDGRPRCQKHSKQRGTQCGNAAMDGMDCCDKHGGKSPRGTDNPNFKHGGYSRYAPAIPEKWRRAVEAERTDEELLSLRRQIAVAEAVEGEILEGLATAPPGDWSAAKDQYQALRAAVRAQDPKAMGEAMTALGALIERGGSATEQVERLLAIQRHLSSLKGQELRLYQLKADVITARDMELLMRQVVGILYEEVGTDKAAWGRIFQRVSGLLPATLAPTGTGG